MTDLIIRGRKRLAEIRAHNGQAALNDGPAYDPDADLLEALLDALEALIAAREALEGPVSACIHCGGPLETGPRGFTDCPACNPNPARE